MPVFVSMDELELVTQEIQARLDAREPEAAMEGMHVQFKMLLPVNLINAVAVNAGTAVVLGYMRSDPEANQHGPPASF